MFESHAKAKSYLIFTAILIVQQKQKLKKYRWLMLGTYNLSELFFFFLSGRKIWDKLFKNGPNKTCERQPSKI